MIKRLTREVVQMTIIVLVMYLIASIIRFIGAGVLVMYLIASVIKFIGAGALVMYLIASVIKFIEAGGHAEYHNSSSGYELDASFTYDIINI